MQGNQKGKLFDRQAFPMFYHKKKTIIQSLDSSFGPQSSTSTLKNMHKSTFGDVLARGESLEARHSWVLQKWRKGREYLTVPDVLKKTVSPLFKIISIQTHLTLSIVWKK